MIASTTLLLASPHLKYVQCWSRFLSTQSLVSKLWGELKSFIASNQDYSSYSKTKGTQISIEALLDLESTVANKHGKAHLWVWTTRYHRSIEQVSSTTKSIRTPCMRSYVSSTQMILAKWLRQLRPKRCETKPGSFSWKRVMLSLKERISRMRPVANRHSFFTWAVFFGRYGTWKLLPGNLWSH